MAVTDGDGLTFTVNVTGIPEHPLEVGVIVYTAVPPVPAVTVKVWAILLPLPSEAPDTPVCTTVQLKVVPGMLLNATEVVLPEQIVCEDGAIAGVGLTVTVTVTGAPLQPLRDGVTVYTAVPLVLPVVVKLWAIVLPLPAKAPDTPVCTTVQLKPVPATLLLKATDVVPPEQKD